MKLIKHITSHMQKAALLINFFSNSFPTLPQLCSYVSLPTGYWLVLANKKHYQREIGGQEERRGQGISFLSLLLASLGVAGSTSMASPSSCSSHFMVPDPTVAIGPTRQPRLLGSVKPLPLFYAAQAFERGGGVGVRMVVGCGSTFLPLYLSCLTSLSLAFSSSCNKFLL